jgi:acyl-CoA synthetase (NDP forming)
VDAGLAVPELDEATCEALRAAGVATRNPLDLGAGVSPEVAAAALRVVATSPAVDAVITVFADLAITDPIPMDDALAAAAAAVEKPVVAVAIGAPSHTRELPGTARQLPVFPFPEEAAASLGVAHRYARQRERLQSAPRRPDDVDAAAARALVDAALRDGRQWLPPKDAFTLLGHYGIPVCPYAIVTDANAAVAAAETLGHPLAAKVATPGLHKTEAGGVRLGIQDEANLRSAVQALRGIGDGGVLLQPMIAAGTELIVGSVHDPQCGPLLMVGAGGVLTDVLGDRAFGLAPITDADADELINSLRSARLLDGYRGAPVVSRAAVRDVLVRVGALVDDVPQIAELDINPLIARTDGLYVVDTRIRLAEPPRHPDPLVRQLRGPRGEG